MLTDTRIGNIVALQLAAVISYLPLNFEHVPGGTYTEKELSAVYTDLLEYSAYNFEPTKTWGLRGSLATAMPPLNSAVTERVNNVTGPTPGRGDDAGESEIQMFGVNFTKSLLVQGTSVDVTSDILLGNGYSVIGAVGLVVCPPAALAPPTCQSGLITVYRASSHKSSTSTSARRTRAIGTGSSSCPRQTESPRPKRATTRS